MENARPVEARRGLLFALSELAHVLRAWVMGRGDLIGLLVAWAEVVTGQVVTE